MTTLGIDVSRWQGEIDWFAVARAGVKFAAIRATVGDYYKDPMFERNWAGALAAGILVGAYHVVAWHRPVAAQIAHLESVMGDKLPHLPVVLDIEEVQEKMPVESMLDEAVSMTVHRFGRPLIYTAGWCWNDYIKSPNWRSYDMLWVASYNRPAPILPNNWDTYYFWQRTNEGNVSGINGHVDMDEFTWDFARLVQWCTNWREQYAEARNKVPVADIELRLRSLEERVTMLEGFKLSWPTEYRVTTQAFGANPQNYARFGLPGHEGLDMRAPNGSLVTACAPGTVYMIHDGSDNHPYGRHVRIDHGNGYKTIYAHLLSPSVGVGQVVQRGQTIGLADNTGNSSGSHLHLTLKKAGATAAGETEYPNDIVDPTPYMM